MAEKPHCRRSRASRGDHVVDEQDLLPLEQCVCVHLERVDPVFQLVFLPHGLVWELARLAQRDESGPDAVCHRSGQGEPTSLDAGHLGHALGLEGLCERSDQIGERFGVSEDWCDVLEHHPRLGKVGDVAYQCFELVHTESLRPAQRLPDLLRLSIRSARSTQPGSVSFHVARRGAAMKTDE